MIVNLRDCVAFPTVTLIGTTIGAVTDWVAIAKFTVFVPGANVIDNGTLATFGAKFVSVANTGTVERPPRVIVPVRMPPPVIEAALTVTLRSFGAVTSKVADAVTPLAVMDIVTTDVSIAEVTRQPWCISS